MDKIARPDSEFKEFSMVILKATNKDGEMRFRAVNSDTGKDVYGEQMSTDLFHDFVAHIEHNDPFPEKFKSAICEPEWCGGMPYISLAHYKSGAGKINVPGEPEKIYMDGNSLKSTGILYDSPLGQAVFKSMQKDFVEKRQDKIRVSIGFLDLQHSHGDRYTFTRKALGEKCPLCEEGIGDKIYKKGYLVHLAFTRKPANPRTNTELELKSMTTKLEDALSIVEDEEVLKGLELKSQAEDVLVVRAEEPEVEKAVEPVVEPVVVPVVVASTTDPRGYKEVEPVVENTVFPELTPVQKSIASLVERVANLKSQGKTGEAALQEIQPVFEELGNVIKAELTPAPTPESIATQNIETTLRSLLAEMLPQLLAQTVAPMQSDIGELRALSAVRQPAVPQEVAPQPRSLDYSLVRKAAVDSMVQKSVKSFAEIARESTGLR